MVLHGDEITLQVLKEPRRTSTSKSYMWVYRTSVYTEYPLTRQGLPQGLFRLAAYGRLPGVTNCPRISG
ncbi:IS66 family transposase [Allofournierella sp. CML151]|uniref:IS66 family transposase n=1 Tax=Allofournierella sp. CML151 TaxID=2998082 RepID=UPI0022EAEF37|nr:transposase [Fournierella sp. CML151]